MGTGRHLVVFDSSCERFDSRKEFYQAIDRLSSEPDKSIIHQKRKLRL